MGRFSPRQRGELRSQFPASDLTAALRAQLATAAQGAKADAAATDVAFSAFRDRAAGFATAAQGATADSAYALALAAGARGACWAIVADAGVAGGALSVGPNLRKLTTPGFVGISGASLSVSTGLVTVPSGNYLASAWVAGAGLGYHQLVLELGGGASYVYGELAHCPATVGVARVSGSFVAGGDLSVGLAHYVEIAPGAAEDGGRPSDSVLALGAPEVYGGLLLWRMV